MRNVTTILKRRRTEASAQGARAPQVFRSPLCLSEPEIGTIASALVEEHGDAASPLAKRTAIAAFEQGDLPGFAAWCAVIIALNKSNLGDTRHV